MKNAVLKSICKLGLTVHMAAAAVFGLYLIYDALPFWVCLCGMAWCLFCTRVLWAAFVRLELAGRRRRRRLRLPAASSAASAKEASVPAAA